ncbi:MAG TPA: hypothetical protein VMZ06_15605 [Candidatus Bathyarchaeia archaeon]|nr:hypothetical protein [Candidatus Bathyarchaeia archaeon]
MTYTIDIIDSWGRRLASFDNVPLFEATRSTPNAPDTIRGILPGPVADIGHGYLVRVYVDGALFCQGRITRISPQWSDTRKLILDRYVPFHEVIEIEAERPAREGNAHVSRCYTNQTVSAIVKGVINTAVDPIHYLVEHAAYPDGAQREYQKFQARRLPENELEVGGISEGQWVGADRIDASAAYAKDGDTIAGLVVDGVAWPDLRMMLIDCEEMSRNSHAINRHPEVAGWTDETYAASGYKLKAEAAKQQLQDLLDEHGIDYIELNPHRNAAGEFDDRVDIYGRYLGLVYGGGRCFNAAQVELGHADVYLWQDGEYLVPELELKDFFSYAGAHQDSVESIASTLTSLDISGGALEILTALAYLGGCIWSLSPEMAVTFRSPQRPDAVVCFDPINTWVALGSESRELINAFYFEGNPVHAGIQKTYYRQGSIEEFGFQPATLPYYSIRFEEDADKLAEGLLDDVAYPQPTGFVRFYCGESRIAVGDIVEVRDGALRRLEREVDGEWGGRFTGKLTGRVQQVTHRFSGRQITTTARLTSPLRSVGSPASFMIRAQEPAKSLYQFRLDEAAVGLDMGYHLE